jgi:hypothetical protein
LADKASRLRDFAARDDPGEQRSGDPIRSHDRELTDKGKSNGMVGFCALLGVSDPLSSGAEGLSKLVEQGGKSPLAFAALAVVLIAFLALWFFKRAPLGVKVTIFSVLLVIGTAFAIAYYRQVFPHRHGTKPKADVFAHFDDQFEVILTASTSFFDPIRGHPVKSNDVPHFHAYAPTHWIDVFPYAYIVQRMLNLVKAVHTTTLPTTPKLREI